MNVTISTLAIAGVAGLIGKIIYDWLKNRNGNGSGRSDADFKKCVYGMAEKINTTVSGVKNLETKMERVVEENIKQTMFLEQIAKK